MEEEPRGSALKFLPLGKAGRCNLITLWTADARRTKDDGPTLPFPFHLPLEGKKYSPSVERKVRRNALRRRCRRRRWSGRRGAGAHILFARSVLLGLGPTVKDHSAVARSAPTFDGKSLARMMPASARTYYAHASLKEANF